MACEPVNLLINSGMTSWSVFVLLRPCYDISFSLIQPLFRKLGKRKTLRAPFRQREHERHGNPEKKRPYTCKTSAQTAILDESLLKMSLRMSGELETKVIILLFLLLGKLQGFSLFAIMCTSPGFWTIFTFSII